MSLAAIFPAVLLETTLAPIALLFLAGAKGNEDAARQAALEALAAYNPETEDELRLAAQTVGCGIRSLQALGDSAVTGLPLAAAMRLISASVNLGRAAEAASRRLRELRKMRQQAAATKAIAGALAAQQPKSSQQQSSSNQPSPPQVAPRTQADTADETGKIAAIAKANGITWTQAYNKRQQDLRAAANQTRTASQPAPASAAIVPHANPAHLLTASA